MDKDKQAAEVARLNLMLKALHVRDKLPMLRNIVEKDSLISGTDEELCKYFGAKWKDKEPICWEREFPKVMAEGGFDVVVGNPPYLLLQPQNIPANELKYYHNKFSVAQFKVDIFHLFIERAIQLLKPGGLLGFITPSTFLTNNYTTNLRRYILDNCEVQSLLVVPNGVFEDASVDNVIFVFRKQSDHEYRHKNMVLFQRATVDRRTGLELTKTQSVAQIAFDSSPTLLFAAGQSENTSGLLEKLESQAVKLGGLARIHFGMQLRDRGKFPKDVVETENPKRLAKSYKPCLTGKDIDRYSKKFNNRYAYVHEDARRGGCWDMEIHLAPEKVLVRQIGVVPIVSCDDERLCCLNTVFMIVLQEKAYSPKYILGLLNSKVIGTYWKGRFSDYKETFPKIKGTYLKELPIRRINFDDAAEKQQHDAIVALVEEMLQLQKDYAEAERHKEDRRHALGARIEQVDAAIDQIVYRLYDLSAEEIRVVEGKEEIK